MKLISERETVTMDAAAIRDARRAQLAWEKQPLSLRAQIVGSLRHGIAEEAAALATATAAGGNRPVAEKLVSEILPLADACKFLERHGAKILQTQRFGRRGRPLWLSGSSFEVQRQPHGVVLIIAPRNYPLFLPAVQALQALVAGNAVLLKPAPNGARPLHEFIDRVLAKSAIPRELFQILPESAEAAHAAVRSGVDLVIFTGDSENGRDLLATMATRNTPGIMELSGADAVFVLRDADTARAARAIAFGLSLNGGDTCMAPHGIIAHSAAAVQLREKLRDLGLERVTITEVASDRDALELAASAEHGLGASAFSRDERAAKNFARELHTGFVTINDIIVATADPRFPFGGTRASGYGVTRGAEGLLALTRPHVVAVRRGGRLPHLEPAEPGDAVMFESFIGAIHRRGWRARVSAVARLIRAAQRRTRGPRE